LDDASKQLTTFCTPWGKLYRYCRLNMGLSIASEIYQDVMTNLLSNLSNVKVAIDDILVYGKTIDEHDRCLHALLTRLVELNVTLSPKSVFRQTEVTFFGLVISKDGIKPNEKKMQDFKDATAPKDAKQLASFLGLAGYFSNRIVDFSVKAKPLRELLKKRVKFLWKDHHDKAFQQLKEALITTCLGHFDVNDSTELWVDAGPEGVAAFLVQMKNKDETTRRLIACASKSFTKPELNYSQVEKEGYAGVWAIEHFHAFLYGQPFKLMSDNKAIVQIFENNESKRKTPIRLQCWRSRLTQYRLMQPTFIKGTSNIADYLSRCLKHKLYIPHEDLQLNVNQLTLDTEKAINKLKTPNITFEELIDHTNKDVELQLIKRHVTHHLQHINCKIAEVFHPIMDRISVTENGLLLKDDQIIIPSTLRQKVIERAHENHMGIGPMTRLLKQHYYFPLMDKLLKEKVKNCLPCLTNVDTTRTLPIKSTEIPNRKWKLVSIDFSSMTPSGDYILVLVCEYARYPILRFTRNMTSTTVIKAMKQVFQVYGVPEIIKSDNGPCFASKQFAEFAQHFNFKHQKIVPEHPQGNAMCERFMKNINKQIRIAIVTGENWKVNLLKYLNDYKNTPHSTTLVSPNELFGKENKDWPTLKQVESESSLQAKAVFSDHKNKQFQKCYADKLWYEMLVSLK